MSTHHATLNQCVEQSHHKIFIFPGHRNMQLYFFFSPLISGQPEGHVCLDQEPILNLDLYYVHKYISYALEIS